MSKPTPCPDCGQPLDRPAIPVTHLDGQPVWCAYCESSRPRAAHRPRLDPKSARVVRPLRLHPDTIAKIDREAKRTGVSAGRVVDALAKPLP